MPFAARKPSHGASAGYDPEILDELNDACRDIIQAVPADAVKHGLRKLLRAEMLESKDDLAKILDFACTLSAITHLFTPGLSGARPIDRLARTTAGGDARALKALAGSKFAIFHVESFEGRDRAVARDCVTGATLRLVAYHLDDVLAECDVATRLCPVGDGLLWPMGPIIPLGPPGAAAALRLPSRPGKGLINEGAVAAQIYREYLRIGAPLGSGFGLGATEEVKLSFVDEELADYADDMLERGQGPLPSGEALSQLRNLASIPRLAMAISCAVELADQGLPEWAAVYRAAARILLDVLAERARIGSKVAAHFAGLRADVAEFFAPNPPPPGVAALLETLLAETRVGGAGGETEDEALARVIERIRALRLKTVEMGCTEQEAMRAAEKVAELLERYGLSLSEVELRKQACEGFGFDTGRKQTGPLDECLRAVAHFCDCRMWSETATDGGLRQVFFGLPADIEAARCLKDLVSAAFDLETEAFKRAELYLKEPSSRRRAMVKSFQIGLGGGISHKLLELKAAREKAATKSTGRDLMTVKRSIIDEEMEKLGLSFRTKTQRRKRVIADAYQQGVAAARRFEVNEKIG